MHAHTCYLHLSRSGVEVLVFYFSNLASVHGVSPFATETFHIEKMCSHSYFLIRVETHADFAVFHLGMLFQPHHCLNNFGYTGFVVGSEQRVSVCNNQILTFMRKQFGEHLWRKHATAAFGKQDVRTVVIFHYTRFDICAAAVGTRVVMRNETDCRNFLVGICRQSGVYISVLVKIHVIKSEFFQLVFQMLRKHKLFRCAWSSVGSFARLGIVTHIV